MIATAERSGCRGNSASRNDEFLRIMPKIRRYAQAAFRRRQGDAKDDAVQEVVANAYVAFVALIQRGKQDLVYASVLARFAIAQVRAGRKVGNRSCVREVLSPYAQRRKEFRVERLDRFDHHQGEWFEAVVEDRRTPIIDQVAFRLDFPAWLETLSGRNRDIVLHLAQSNTTSETARRFGVSPGRVSQLRHEYRQSWQVFCGDKDFLGQPCQ